MYLLFDIGGTHMRLALSRDGKEIEGAPHVEDTPQKFEEALERIAAITKELTSGAHVDAAAGGVPGPLDADRTKLIRAPHLADWIEKPLKEKFEQIFDAPVYLENDAALAGLGEAVRGAGVGFRIMAYITIGTGVGGARIVSRQIDTSALGFEPGHQIINHSKNVEETLEQLISGTAIEKRYQKKPFELDDSAAWDEIAWHLSAGLTNTIVHWSPDIVIIGGSVAQKIPIEKVGMYVGKLLTIFPQGVPIAKAVLGDSSGLYGAIEHLHEKHLQNLTA